MSEASARVQQAAARLRTEQAEWDVRVQLAACYRLAARFGWTDLIYTHISARLPGPERCFLMNPYGLTFDEITASNLIKVDFDGNIVGHSKWPMNHAGFVIHSAILGGRPDINCVLHTHTRSGVAVSTLRCGLLPISQFALFYYNRVAYHDYEGIACDLDERQRLVAHLGDKWVMILRNHGLLTAGRSIAEALVTMDQLERACAVQIDAQSTGAEIILPAPEICESTARTAEGNGQPFGEAEWSALVRMLDREDPSYRD